MYNFKKLTVVPSAKDFIDIVLSKTQRKTPTVIHKGQAMPVIRRFYVRKVKFTAQTYHDKLTQILDEFPVLNEIHPFYADLMNVLYDKDHYKLALGQLSHTRSLVDQIGKDYVRLLKYGASLYSCKQLKRAALGRMCTLMKKQATSLAYLEQVRQHLARLPSIDANTRTLIVCGYPNVGKSSFMNRMTRANVEVQPYAFTTKSLFVGHMDYRYIRWQVLDTPGILDHPLDDMNTIEMQSITALVHLKAAVIFVMDLSEQCGYSIAQQVALFQSIKPLFQGKPLVVAVNKVDLMRPEQLTDDNKALIQSMEGPGVDFVPMSTLTEEGIADVKQLACDKLLAQRVEQKLAAHARIANQLPNTLSDTDGSTQQRQQHHAAFLGRLHVAIPQPRDSIPRPAYVPESVWRKRNDMQQDEDKDEEEEGETNGDAKDTMDAEGARREKKPAVNSMALSRKVRGVHETQDFNFFHPDSKLTDPTVFGIDFRKDYQLANDEWRFDAVPEIVDGRNVQDYIDPDIDQKLAELEAEEDERLRLMAAAAEDEQTIDFTVSERTSLEQVRAEKRAARTASILRKRRNRTSMATIPRTTTQFETHLRAAGIDPTAAVQRARSRSVSRSRRLQTERGRKRDREMDIDSAARSVSASASAARSRSRSLSQRLPGEPGSGFASAAQHSRAESLGRRAQRDRNRDARRGEADRAVASKKPKHLFSGKRSVGKTDRR